MRRSVLRHPRRDEAEALIREGRLRRWQIAERCEASMESVTRWAQEMGVPRIQRGPGIRAARSAWRPEAVALLAQGLSVTEVARRMERSRNAIHALKRALRQAKAGQSDALPTEGR